MAKEQERLDFKEAITLFLDRTMDDLKTEEEIPALNILFPEKTFELFEYVKKHPFQQEGVWIPGLHDKDIERARPENQQDKSCPTIHVNNPTQFFELLTDITNAWIDQKNKYYGAASPRALFIQSIKRLFLRMTPHDLFYIEDFLELQLSFLKSTTFDEMIKKEIKVAEYEGYDIISSKAENATWCETNDKMKFYLKGSDSQIHTLPSIYFQTTIEQGKTVCYIYAIQNESTRNKSKIIQKKLYHLNAGIENPDVNPGSVLALKIFINMLHDKGITEIRVPTSQVLSYRYHEILSETTKRNFQEKYSPEKLREINDLPNWRKQIKLEEYELDKIWYSHVVDKQDFIEEAKTQGLFRVFNRVATQFDILESINNEITTDYLNFKIKEKRLIKSLL